MARTRRLRPVLVAAFSLSLGLVPACSKATTTSAPLTLAQFYATPSTFPSGQPGDIVRSQALTTAPAGSKGWRIMYLTTDALGKRALSTGVVYAPEGTAPSGGRPVVAWAHPTIGVAASCAPSMLSDPSTTMSAWLGSMLQMGMVVTATDYTGLGTPGILPYLVSKGEADNILDSVRAAANLAGTGAGTGFVAWGHSQGGHAILSVAGEIASYAPKLHLLGEAGAAPAAEIAPLVNLQWNSPVAWAIGPEAFASWPQVDPSLQASQVATPLALSETAKIGAICLTNATDITALEQQFGPDLLQPFFAVNPTTLPAWAGFIQQNTPGAPSGVPVFVAQGQADTVVLPATTALLETSWCAAGTSVDVDWVPTATHFTVVTMAAPQAVAWIAGRFTGAPSGSTCSTPPPVTPAAAG